MPGRKKRSELVGESASLAVPSVRISVTPSQRRRRADRSVLSAFCPICAHSIPEHRATRRSKMGVLETAPYFESIEWNPEQPFGIRMAATGKKSFETWSYVSPDQAPELFGAMKGRFLVALTEWLRKGWISEGDVLAALGESRSPARPSHGPGSTGNGNGEGPD